MDVSLANMLDVSNPLYMTARLEKTMRRRTGSTMNNWPPHMYMRWLKEMICEIISMHFLSMACYFSTFVVSEGDGQRIIRCWKFFLLFLKGDGQRSCKYALEGLNIMCQIYALLSPRDAHRLIWNRSVKAKSEMGGNIPLDLALEHFNRVL